MVRHIETDLAMTKKAVSSSDSSAESRHAPMVTSCCTERFGINSASGLFGCGDVNDESTWSTSGIPSIEVGRALAKGHFRAAVDAVLDPSFALGHEERQAKDKWASG
eukprot:763301-Hanusia_phi.AAC.2